MQFQTTYLDRPVIVDYSNATDLSEDLDGVVITYLPAGEEINYNNISDGEWFRLWEETHGEAIANLADSHFGD